MAIPNFWDPNRRLDKPAAGSITSIRFATTDDFPPFNFAGADGNLTGFNVDLARAICQELAIPCTIQARPWSGLAEDVVAGRVDAAIAGIAVTPESAAKLSFSDVYLRAAARFAARRGSATASISPSSLAGRKIAVVQGSAHEAYLRAFFPKAQPVAFENAILAQTALKDGQAELMFADGGRTAFWLQSQASNDCCGFVGGPYLEPRFFGNGMAIAMPPEHRELRDAINWALDDLYDKGLFAELYLRYFPVGYF